MNAMTKAHEIRKAAAEKWNCNISEIHFGECLRLAHKNSPLIGFTYSPCQDGRYMQLKLISECEEWFYFDTGVRHNKDLPFSWFLVTPEKKHEADSASYDIDYPAHAMQLAENYSIEELESMLHEAEVVTDKYTEQHLRAIEATTSMQSNSQRRAQAGNQVIANYEKKQSYRWALEILTGDAIQ